MKTAFSCALLALAGATALGTDYSKDRALKIESQFQLATETETSRERDGQPVEGRGGGGSMKSDTTWHVVQVDEVLAHEGKKPTKVKRNYEKVGGEATMAFGENENTAQLESPFEGATLQLSGDDDDVKVEFLDGKKPDHEAALVGHKLGLALDALLPDKEVDKDAHWDLDSAQIKRALGLDLRKALFPPPPAPENAGGGGGGGGGGRRGGMGRGGGMGGIPGDAEWTGKAKLVSLDEEVDGVKCAKIEIEIATHGDLPDQPMGGGGRGRMLEPESALPLFAGTYSGEAKGEFYFALDGKRPVKLELEGKVESTRDSEMKREEVVTKMHSKMQGKLKVKVEVTEQAKAKDEKPK
jgi:hypothetical protein